MITSLISSFLRVLLTWYTVGCLVISLGNPEWAEGLYQSLSRYPWVPELEFSGIWSSLQIQLNLLIYWTIPAVLLWASVLALSFLSAQGYVALKGRSILGEIKPRGAFYGVFVPSYSLGGLPMSTAPGLAGDKVSFVGPGIAAGTGLPVEVSGKVAEVISWMDEAERNMCAELVQLLMGKPDHYAGAGHGVGLLQHTLNVVSAVANRCTPDFRLPFVAALGHDVGKLITFKQSETGEWFRKGLHSRESARIMAALPAFTSLSDTIQRAILLAVQYDHAPNKMPYLRGDKDSAMLALRIINALSAADRQATAEEKDRNLERLKPEDLLWQDFVAYLREAPVVQVGRGTKASNQVNNPVDSPFLFVYENTWRDAAIRRLPEEVAAALDLNRRDTGKLAKYTRILAERLRQEGVLVEQHAGQSVTEANPLWDIQSGFPKPGQKPQVFRGILVLYSEALWKKLNYKIATKSPYTVTILGPNADPSGRVNAAPSPKAAPGPEVVEGVSVPDVTALMAESSGPKRKPYEAATEQVKEESAQASFGFTDTPASAAGSNLSKPQHAKRAAAEPSVLSRTEQAEGLLLADAAAIEQYPRLKLGDKFYPHDAPMVIRGYIKAGTVATPGALVVAPEAATVSTAMAPATATPQTLRADAPAAAEVEAPLTEVAEKSLGEVRSAAAVGATQALESSSPNTSEPTPEKTAQPPKKAEAHAQASTAKPKDKSSQGTPSRQAPPRNEQESLGLGDNAPATVASGAGIKRRKF